MEQNKTARKKQEEKKLLTDRIDKNIAQLNQSQRSKSGAAESQGDIEEANEEDEDEEEKKEGEEGEEMEEFKDEQNEDANVQAEVQQKALDASVKKGKTLYLPTIETMLFNME